MDVTLGKAEWRKTWTRLNLGPAINGHPVIVFQSAQLLYARGERRAAEGAFREVLAGAPKHLPTLGWLVCLLQNQGRFAEADTFRRRKREVEAELAEARAKEEAAREPGPINDRQTNTLLPQEICPRCFVGRSFTLGGQPDG